MIRIVLLWDNFVFHYYCVLFPPFLFQNVRSKEINFVEFTNFLANSTKRAVCGTLVEISFRSDGKRGTPILAIQIGRWSEAPIFIPRPLLHLTAQRRRVGRKRGKRKTKSEKGKRRRGRGANHHQMAPPPPGRPAWSITVRLRHRGWLDLRAAAENVVLPGWGRGGERLSLLVRLRRGLRLAVTSRCGRAPPEKNPRACRIFRFLRSKLARFPSIWRRKKPPPPARATAASQVIQ